ncbi:MAG: HD domain-containing protein [Bacteroidaceae bacterium]|nr:HD domain-containing protein [Bacteroidaceae bacterium]
MNRNNLTAELIYLIEEEIMPRYEDFDKAHDRRHAFTVMSHSLQLTKFYDVDIAMVYTIAAYHDLGLSEGRATHHTASARIVREDERLRQFFTQEQIDTIADAVEDHRASNTREPRTIYGKIIAEADRIIDADTIMTRTVQYGLSHYPTLTKEEHIERAVTHIHEKYGRGGYLKLWIPESPNAARLEEFRSMIDNAGRLKKHLEEIWDREQQDSK